MDAQPEPLQIKPRRLPAYVERNRARQAATDTADHKRYGKVIDAHVAAQRMALDGLEHVHQQLADGYDFDLVADTRPAAIWQMSGRCIGIARLILDAVALGYTSEHLILIRSLHEADRLLDVFCDSAESGLLALWLADERTIKPSEPRKAEQRFEEGLVEWMTEEGLPELPRTEQRTRTLYGKYSEAAHHRRAYVQELVSSPLRQMLRGPATAWERRAVAVGVAVAAVEEAVESVGGGLAFFYGAPWYEQNIKPYIESFAALRQAQPLR
jgi:hypothetical protein